LVPIDPQLSSREWRLFACSGHFPGVNRYFARGLAVIVPATRYFAVPVAEMIERRVDMRAGVP
jgi:hypothetical protein